MSRAHSFSIYLLKESFGPENSLKEDSKLEGPIAANNLPDGSILYLLDTFPHPPWWKNYWGIEKDLSQALEGAMIFLPVKSRFCVLTFGHVYHNLKEGSYEYDFGLRVTLNALDPEKLKSTDTVEPGIAKRQRIQSPNYSNLTYFDFDRDTSMVKSLTGRVKEEYQDFFKQATGSANFRVSSKASPSEIIRLCEKAVELYEKDDYLSSFPDIQNIVPVKDPILIEQLEGNLIKSFKEQDTTLQLCVPEIIDYQSSFDITFSGVGSGLVYDDVSILFYHEYLNRNGTKVEDVSANMLKSHSLVICDEDGIKLKSFKLYKCLLYDTQLESYNMRTYHLCDGSWYEINNDYIKLLKEQLDPHFKENSDFIPYQHTSEADYNSAVENTNSKYLCLDRKNISPKGQTAVEPCDLFSVDDNTAIFVHVKRSTRSSQLSHLFNQGANVIELIKVEPAAKQNIKNLLEEKMNGSDTASRYIQSIEGGYKVVYAIITHKDKERKSNALPLFSRISLSRTVRMLKIMGVEVDVCLILDGSEKKAGEVKNRKKKGAG